MNRNNSIAKKYCLKVRGWLPCSRKLKNQIVAEIRENVTNFLAENPDADYAQVEERFGKPQSIASAYVDDMDTVSILRGLRIRRKVMAALCGIAAVVCCSAVVMVLQWQASMNEIIEYHRTHYPGYIEVAIFDETYDPSQETNVEEFYP